jgi:hypothetical protein
MVESSPPPFLRLAAHPLRWRLTSELSRSDRRVGELCALAGRRQSLVSYKDRVGELRAHQLSTGTAIAFFAGYFEWLARRYPLASTREALEVGTAWLALTVAFEFGFGRGVAHTSMDELLADYDLRKGRRWPLVLAWVVLGPAVVRARRAS